MEFTELTHMPYSPNDDNRVFRRLDGDQAVLLHVEAKPEGRRQQAGDLLPGRGPPQSTVRVI